MKNKSNRIILDTNNICEKLIYFCINTMNMFAKQRRLTIQYMQRDTLELKKYLGVDRLVEEEKSFVFTRAWYYARSNKVDPDEKYPYRLLEEYIQSKGYSIDEYRNRCAERMDQMDLDKLRN